MVWLQVAMLSMVVLQAPASPQRECVLEGVLSLKSPDAQVDVTGAVVYLQDGPPSALLEPSTHIMRQRNFQFSPRTLVVLQNDSVSFVNEDKQTEHSVFSRLGKDPFNGDVNKKMTTFNRSFAREGHVHIQCDIHEEMWADILVLKSPAYARPDSKGAWSIKGLERKNYTLVAWEPNGGEERVEVVCGAGKINLKLQGKERPRALHRNGNVFKRGDYPDTY